MEAERIISAHDKCWQTPEDLVSKTARKKKKKIKRQSVVALWQSIMYSRCGWQQKLSPDDYERLDQFGRRTHEFGYLILQWAMDKWEEFAQEATGESGQYPSSPNAAFFSTYQAVAFHLWLHAKWTSEEEEAFGAALDSSLTSIEELEIFYTLGEEALFPNVASQLEDKGLLKKHSQGWEVCGQVFKYKTAIYDKYMNDEGFRSVLRNAATG